MTTPSSAATVWTCPSCYESNVGPLCSKCSQPKPSSVARHKFDVWRDDFSEWVWACLCEMGRLHGGYSTEESARREATAHAD